MDPAVPFQTIRFVDGTVPPVSSNRNGTGSILGFNFGPGILSGTSSRVFVIFTNATDFSTGTGFELSGLTGTNQFTYLSLGSIVPTGPAVPVTTVPDQGTSALLLSLSVAMLVVTQRTFTARGRIRQASV